MRHWFWMRLVPALASVKLAVGLAAFFLTYERFAGDDALFPYIFFLLFILAFGATAALLLLGGRNDRRAFALGGFFLVAATAWCNGLLRRAAELEGIPGTPLFVLVDALELDCFIPFFLWYFVRDFPHAPASPRVRSWLNAAIRVSSMAGILLFSVNLAGFAASQLFGGWGSELSGLFAPQRGTGIYYSVVMGLTAAALPVLLWKAFVLKGPDQRRVRLFLFVLGVTVAPALLESLLELFLPGYRDFTLRHPDLKLAIIAAVLSVALTVPVTVPYAVLVHRVLDVKLIARRALHYALARTSVLVFVAAPLLSLAWYFYAHRSQSLSEIFSGVRVVLLLSASALGVAALYYRKALLDLIDRRFFREQYDARQILTLLVERIRGINEAESLASLVSREIDLALHLEGIAMMVLDPRSGTLVDPRSRARRLDASSALALTISNASAPLEVDLEHAQSRLKKLPERERHWLVDSGFRLIVPILARDGSLLGLVGLGEKKSGLPFLKDDRQLLHAIASSAAWVLELEQGRAGVPRRSWQDLEPDDATPSQVPSLAAEHAKECANCGVVFQSYTVFCANCSRRLEVSRVPFVLPGKFRFEKRIGAGGMGVVYRGADLALGRHVAIKTLRRVSPEDAMRLRREARTAAAVSHPHLAAVYGMETWQGTPLLVMELLEGGTLVQKMANGCRMAPARMVDLGIAMTEALAHLHAADILHRDIKPSNIGYTRDGAPKLMDFGIAGLVLDLRREEDLALLSDAEDDSVLMPPASVWGQNGSTPPLSRLQLAGTLSYLSPEALNREPPDASFDLWSLGIVLYECLLGRKIFTGVDSQQLMARIRHGRVPEFSQVLPEYEEVLGDFFRQTLHRTRSRRPATARDLRRWLLEIRPSVAHLDEAGPAA